MAEKSTSNNDAAVKAAYKVINEADPETAVQLARIREMYKKVDDVDAGEVAIEGMLNSGPGAAARLKRTADVIAERWELE